MERKIEIRPGDNLESVVYTLLAAKARGEHVYCNFNGHELHSDNVTMDSAYTEVMGCTKAEYEQRMKEWRENYAKEKKARESREQGYAEKVNASRTDEKKPITSEEVISGLKFIAEHQSMSHEELVNGLLELGCNFSLEDIKQQFKQQFTEEIKLDEGMKQGNFACGASVIANVRDSELGRKFCNIDFLSLDNDTSIYHFIRVTTGDESYTKEMVDALNNANGKHR